MRRTGKLISLAVSGLAGVVFFAAGTPLGSADSNLSNFLKHVGWHHPPAAIATRAADHFVQIAAVVVLLIALSFVFDFWSHVHRKRLSAPTASALDFGDHAADDLKRDTHLNEALAFLASGEWGRDLDRALIEMFQNGAPDVFTEVRQGAFDRKITVWGRDNRYDIYRPLDSSYWSNHQIDSGALLNGLERAWGHDGHNCIDLMLNRAQVEALRRSRTAAE